MPLQRVRGWCHHAWPLLLLLLELHQRGSWCLGRVEGDGPRCWGHVVGRCLFLLLLHGLHGWLLLLLLLCLYLLSLLQHLQRCHEGRHRALRVLYL